MYKKISYGNKNLSFCVPDKLRCFELFPNEVKCNSGENAIIDKALEHPIGHTLEDVVKSGQRICIICDDISRPTPTEKILHRLLPRLHGMGIAKKDVYFVFALGSHRPMTSSEVERKLGPTIPKEYTVYQSSFSDPREIINLGNVDGGVNIQVYRRVMESDVRIGIGNIVPHNTLGWSGGSKILFPGVTSEETVSRFHMKAMLQQTGHLFGETENEVRHDVENWARKIGLHFIINTILDRRGNLYQVVAGDYIQAHRAGVAYAREVYCVNAPCKADIVVVDSRPSDCDFWQGTKGFNPADVLLKDGGSCILVSPFYEGVGPHREYPMMIGDEDSSSLLTEVYHRGHAAYPQYDPLALAVGALIGRMRQRFHMYVYSDGVDDELLNQAKIHRTRDLSATIQALAEQYGDGAVVMVVHDGAELVPVLPEETT